MYVDVYVYVYVYVYGDGLCVVVRLYSLSAVVSQYRGLRLTTTFSEGSFFGETAVLWPVREPFTVRTDVDSDFYVLCKAKYEVLVQVLQLRTHF